MQKRFEGKLAMLTGVLVHCLLAFAIVEHYHSIVEGPKE